LNRNHTMSSPIEGFRCALVLFIVIPATMLLLASLETLQAPMAIYTNQPTRLPMVFLHSILGIWFELWIPILFQLGIALVQLIPSNTPRSKTLRDGITILLSAGIIHYARQILVAYEPFAGYLPATALYAGLLVYLAVAMLSIKALSNSTLPGWMLFFKRGITVTALVGAIAFYWVNNATYRSQYPTLHTSQLLLAFILFHLAFAYAFTSRPAVRAGHRSLVAIVICSVVALTSILGFAMQGTRAWTDTYPFFAEYSTLGRTSAMRRSQLDDEHSIAAAKGLLNDWEASERFSASSGLPPLPFDFDLTDYNVLLITSEATRYDKTSLAKPGLRTTPNLAALVKNGALSFPLAYTPSSGTVQSISSLFSMTFPSASHLAVGWKSWNGELKKKAHTVPEILMESGYFTFWYGHNYNSCFTKQMYGFDQGFKKRRLYYERRKGKKKKTATKIYTTTPKEPDEKITEVTLARLARLKKTKQRFFGWVFYVSPHSEYKAHYPQMQAETEQDRYLHELKFLDKQIGRILDYLKSSGLAKNTIVVFMGDHGEEFGEHGGAHHSSTVYEEQTHVPMVVKIPGFSTKVKETPTSTTYLFPWLMQQGSATMRKAAQDRLEREIGPMMLHTDGAVVVELLGQNGMKTALVYPEHKVVYNFLSGLHELYDTKADPYDQDSLIDTEPDLTEKYRKKVTNYLKLRTAMKRFTY
jgi:glucan phosphoethanolaminetransferase (alkaline phosphatase superfamily)